MGPLPEIYDALVYQYYDDEKNKIEVVFNESTDTPIIIGAYVPGEHNLD